MSAGRTVKSQSVHWCTPPEYIDVVKYIFDGTIDLDPCSNDYSIVGAKVEYKLPHNDGLASTWNYRRIYVNPPFGRDYERKTTIKNWLQKCTDVHQEFNSEIIALVPVATNTKHWQKNIFLYASAICFLKATRLKFLQNGILHQKGAPMACAMIYWGNNFAKFSEAMSGFGIVLSMKNP